ncbi:MAG: aminotransferase class IV family protein [Phycisphaeraceae bacterium]|nr:aminotransferase class IV family protein [Phycisphaeraceae bacterium]MCW5761724.1 aminotransferase class IV family protein [Phycisphaeraceae bacterium]
MGQPIVFVQGHWMDRQEAQVSAFDAGLLHGVGLFETMLGLLDTSGDVRVYRLREHLERLARSAKELGLSNDVRIEPLAESVEEAISKAGYARARVRLTLTGGDLNLLEIGGKTNHTPTVIISVQPATSYPLAMFEQGVGATLADARVNPLDPFAGHKTLNYWMRLRELQAAASKGAGEAIVMQVTNHLAGGCVSNVFLVKDWTLHTPIARGEEEPNALPSPVLPGVTREAVSEIAAAKGIGCARRMLSIDDLLDADEVFLTNSSWGVLPVVRIEAEAVGGGTVGPVTRDLLAGLGADIEESL